MSQTLQTEILWDVFNQLLNKETLSKINFDFCFKNIENSDQHLISKL
jgi:hypothetical protein